MRRGAQLTAASLATIKGKYDESMSELLPGQRQSVGNAWVTPRIPFRVGRSALTNALKYFREGKSPADVLSAAKERRSKCGRAKVAAETEDGAKALLAEGDGATHNSQREMAKKLKVSR